jgi:hypothetical protein
MRITVRDDGSSAEEGMDEAMTTRIEQQVRQAFPEGAIARVQVLQYGDDPKPGAMDAAVPAITSRCSNPGSRSQLC